MLIPRIIPCLLVENGAMVKTRRFKKRTYLGDPVNVISLFNNFEVDEIVLLDISASAAGRGPDVELVNMVAEECWVPLTYGGGISQLKQIETLINSGCEKVVLASAVADDLTLMREASKEFGTQAIVGSIDARRKMFHGYETSVTNGKRKLLGPPVERARQFEDAGAGEIFLQSIDRDGEMNGYDLDLIAEVAAATDLPVVACGGAAERGDLARPILEAKASAAAAGSLFVFSGSERGVLINFPDRAYLENLLQARA
jgi:imidazole glycerol-phosphate synthase subunit HisF